MISLEQSKKKMETLIRGRNTKQLIEIARILNLAETNEEILVSVFVEKELEDRLSEEEFLSLMQKFEKELSQA